MLTVFVLAWEEDGLDEIPYLAAGPEGDRLDLIAGDAEISELVVRKAIQLGNSRAIRAPVTIVADQVH